MASPSGGDATSWKNKFYAVLCLVIVVSLGLCFGRETLCATIIEPKLGAACSPSTWEPKGGAESGEFDDDLPWNVIPLGPGRPRLSCVYQKIFSCVHVPLYGNLHLPWSFNYTYYQEPGKNARFTSLSDQRDAAEQDWLVKQTGNVDSTLISLDFLGLHDSYFFAFLEKVGVEMLKLKIGACFAVYFFVMLLFGLFYQCTFNRRRLPLPSAEDLEDLPADDSDEAKKAKKTAGQPRKFGQKHHPHDFIHGGEMSCAGILKFSGEMCGDKWVCFWACCCPSVRAADTFSTAGKEGKPNFLGVFMALVLVEILGPMIFLLNPGDCDDAPCTLKDLVLMTFFLRALVGAPLRQGLRVRFGSPVPAVHFWKDVFVWLFCAPCAIAQETLEVEKACETNSNSEARSRATEKYSQSWFCHCKRWCGAKGDDNADASYASQGCSAVGNCIGICKKGKGDSREMNPQVRYSQLPQQDNHAVGNSPQSQENSRQSSLPYPRKQ